MKIWAFINGFIFSIHFINVRGDKDEEDREGVKVKNGFSSRNSTEDGEEDGCRLCQKTMRVTGRGGDLIITSAV